MIQGNGYGGQAAAAFPPHQTEPGRMTSNQQIQQMGAMYGSAQYQGQMGQYGSGQGQQQSTAHGQGMIPTYNYNGQQAGNFQHNLQQPPPPPPQQQGQY